jgi:hypothetical protein
MTITSTEKKMRPQYSGGTNSAEFWDRVKNLNDAADHSTVYALGVALQNMEGQVLLALSNAEKNAENRKLTAVRYAATTVAEYPEITVERRRTRLQAQIEQAWRFGAAEGGE